MRAGAEVVQSLLAGVGVPRWWCFRLHLFHSPGGAFGILCCDQGLHGGKAGGWDGWQVSPAPLLPHSC